jgi:hypothetical protein
VIHSWRNRALHFGMGSLFGFFLNTSLRHPHEPAVWFVIAFAVLVGLFTADQPGARVHDPETEYQRREAAALPDGTRVRLACKLPNCRLKDHSGVWRTIWSPRRTGFHDTPDDDDYRLTREGDGATTYAVREALEVVE